MRRLLPYLLLTVAGLGWGLGFPFGKTALRELSAPHMIMLRLGVAGLAAAPYVAFSKEAREVLLRDRWAWISGGFCGVGFLVEFLALKELTVSLAALLVGLMPAIIAAASILWGEKVRAWGWAGVAAATAGAAAIALGAGGAGGTVKGVLITVGSLVIFLGYIYGGLKMRRTQDALAAPAAVVVITALAACAAAAPFVGLPALSLHAETWAALLGSGLLSSLVASACWQIGAKHAPAASAGVFINLEPLTGGMIGVAMFGDPLTAPLITGGALILAGSLLTVLMGHSPESVPAEPA